MGTKSKRKRDKNFQAIPFSATLTLSTLADETVITRILTSGVFTADIFIVSLDALITIRGLTAGEVPINVGVSHSDLSVTEINEALVAEILNPNDRISKERAGRPVRRIGTFANGTLTDQGLADGLMIRQAVKFFVGEGFSLDLFAKNLSGATLTTGANIDISGTIFGRWNR